MKESRAILSKRKKLFAYVSRPQTLFWTINPDPKIAPSGPKSLLLFLASGHDWSITISRDEEKISRCEAKADETRNI